MFEELDTIELTHDIKEHGLKEGDLGAVVNVYNDGKAYEVEFVAPNGRTKALLTLMPNEIRPYIEHKNVFSWFNAPISLGTVSGMTLDTIVNNDKLRITTEAFKSKVDKEEFRYQIATL